MKNNSLISLATKYEDKYNIVSRLDIIKLAYIRKTSDGKWNVLSEEGKSFGIYKYYDWAERKLEQVELFKYKSASECINLTELNELSYSAVMRELRKQCDTEVVREFLSIFKIVFDKLVLSGEEAPADKAMPAALILFSKKHAVEMNHD